MVDMLGLAVHTAHRTLGPPQHNYDLGALSSTPFARNVTIDIICNVHF